MDVNTLSNFRLAIFRFILKPQESLHLPPFKGSTFRGGLGNLFKRTMCISRDRECAACVLREQCAYSYCFETPAGDKGKARSSNWPHPYILEPPFEEKFTYHEDEEIRLNLILIGRGVEFFPYFVFVFDELGRSGVGRERNRYRLDRVESLSPDGDYRSIYDGDQLSNDYEVKTFAEIAQEISSLDCQTITVRFLTPTRILSKGHLIRRELDFPIFMSRLAGRISLLSECHCGERPDFGDLMERAEAVKMSLVNLSWREPERYSFRQKARMKMGGFIGEVTFEGELKEFLPLIKLGEYLHVGNLTSFGLGKYEIVF